MITNPADPFANDLERIRTFYELPSTVPNSTIDNLVAEVEALRERVADREKTTEELAKHLDKTIAVAADAVNRMNAEAARVVELAGALAFYADHKNYIDPHNMAWVPAITYDGGEKARGALDTFKA